VHVPDPLRGSSVAETVGAALAPRFRVLSIRPRAERSYQVQADDLEAVLDQFGVEHVVLVAEGQSCASALLLGAW
jgi:pimeloyl-ACP methyl ester carboxylesterase